MRGEENADKTTTGQECRKQLSYHRTAIGIVSVLFLYRVVLILSGFVDNGGSDESQRLLLANYYAHHWGEFLGDKFFSHTWPPGQFMLLAAVISVSNFLHLDAFVHYVQLGLLVASVAYCASLYLFYRLIDYVRGGAAGLFAIIIYVGARQNIWLSYSGYAETYVLFFCLLAILLCARHIQNRGGIVWAGLCFALASCFHGVAIFVAFACGVDLLLRKRIMSAVIFGVSALSYWIVDFVVAALWFPGSTSYANMGSIYRFAEIPIKERCGNLMGIAWTHVLPDYSVYLWPVGLAFGIVFLFRSERRLLPFIWFVSTAVIGSFLAMAYFYMSFRYLYLGGILFLGILAIAIEDVRCWLTAKIGCRKVVAAALVLRPA